MADLLFININANSFSSRNVYNDLDIEIDEQSDHTHFLDIEITHSGNVFYTALHNKTDLTSK